MTYLSGKAQKRKRNIRYFLYISFFVFIFLFWSTFKTKIYQLIEPSVLKYGATKGIIASVPEFFHIYTSSRKELVQNSKNLEITIERLENELADRDAKLKELNFVASEQGANNSNGSIIVMYPLMNDITRIYSTILLSKGYKDGVEKDAYVYVRGLQPVCIIKEVYTSTSLCELISASGIATEAVINTASGTLALNLVGRGGGTFLGDVARDSEIAVGNQVFLKSDPSMILGKVVDVIHNNQDTSWRVFVSGAYNPITSSIFYIRKK